MQTLSQHELGEHKPPCNKRSAVPPLFWYWVVSVIISLSVSFAVRWSLGPRLQPSASLVDPALPVPAAHATSPEPVTTPEPPKNPREEPPGTDTGKGERMPEAMPEQALRLSTTGISDPAEKVSDETPKTHQVPTGSMVPGATVPRREPVTDVVADEPTDTRPVAVRGIGSFVLVVSSGNAASRTGSDPAALPPAIQRYDVACRSKVVALTFDDGPNPVYTPRVLDVLKQHRATATFFVIGEQARKYPDLIKRIHAEGHEIANHGYTHRVTHSTPYTKQIEDIQKTSKVIESLTGKPTQWYRPNNMLISPVMLHAIEMTGHHMVLWTVDTRDWAARSPDPIVQAVPQDLRQGSVVLLHDGGGNRQSTVEALDQILLRLLERGYRSVTVSDILRDVEGPIPGMTPR